MEEVSENSTMEIHYNATGPRRKELATAVGAFLEATPVYQKAPTYAFAIGEYIIDRDGTLIGTENHAFTEALAGTGFHRSINQQNRKSASRKKNGWR